MGFGDLIKKIRKNMPKREERPDLPDDVTRDKALRSLRRQRRVQNEELEKVKLKNEIADFNKDRTARELFGLKTKNINRRKPSVINKSKKTIGFLGKSDMF